MTSVLIVNWNTRDLLLECLASLHTGLGGKDFEVFVADNASSDGSADAVREKFPWVRLIANQRNDGYAAANNQLAAMSTGDVLLFLNPDTRVMNLGPAHLRLRSDKRIALVAPQLQLPSGGTQDSCRGFPDPWPLIAELSGLAKLFPRKLGSYRMRTFDHESAREVDQPMATCWLMRRDAWAHVGPFDERFPIFFNDVDWCYRAKRDGWTIWFEPAAKVIHHHGAGTRQVRPAMVWESRESLLRYYGKHFSGRISPPLYWFIAAATYLGALAKAKGRHAGYRPDGDYR